MYDFELGFNSITYVIVIHVLLGKQYVIATQALYEIEGEILKFTLKGK